MDPPIPAPRSEPKKPVPTPRRIHSIVPPQSNDKNTLTKRVKSLSSASKQIAGDIGDLVQDIKKAGLEGTRQSVRRLTRKFSGSSTLESSLEPEEPEVNENFGIFDNIKFDSPLSNNNNIYNNVSSDSDESEGNYNRPPPQQPAPVLGVYDAPLSIASSSSDNSLPKMPPKKADYYEFVYPLNKSSYSSDSDLELKQSDPALSRSGSWRFYDPVWKANENIYNEIQPSTSNSKMDELQDPLVASKMGSSASSVEMRNSLYENHKIIEEQKPASPTKSVIYEFDPLCDRTGDLPEFNYNFSLLEELLQGDLYGNISNDNTLDDWSLSNDSEEADDYLNPPTPPVRTDSLPEEDKTKTKTNWFLNKSPSGEVKKHWFKNILDKTLKAKEENIVPRPQLCSGVVQKKGMLYRVQNGPVEDLFGEYSARWCVLEGSTFTCYSDNTCETTKESFPADKILSVAMHESRFKYKHDNNDLHCFELTLAIKGRSAHIYGTKNISERKVWLQSIAECLTSKFSNRVTTDFKRLGWAYLKEGVNGQWVGVWIVLYKRKLQYCADGHSVKTMDLRKARFISAQAYQETDNNPKTNDKGPNIIIDCPGNVIYLRMWTMRETKIWCHYVTLAAYENGAYLKDQQLTKNDVPVIVEKCINHIYIHGSMTEGIYRKPGVGSVVADLLVQFRKNGFAVQLNDKFTEHDVATALKRFFRDLPEPLLGNENRQYLHQVSKLNDRSEKIRMYKSVLERLHPISYNTTKKLLGHLHFISSQSHKNKMNVENLASFWGPSLLQEHKVDGHLGSVSASDNQMDIAVVEQLISLYRYVFPEDQEELEKEKIMLKVLKKYSNSLQGASAVEKKIAGDFKIWIYIHEKEGKSVHVSIGPNKTAYEVCLELSKDTKIPVHELVLEEIVLNDKLVRPVHHSEKVLDVILRWSYWDEADRKDNYLIVSRLSKYWEYIQDRPIPSSGECKFADCKTKSYRPLFFTLSGAKLILYKDKNGGVEVDSWNIEDIILYIGHEAKRAPPTKWTATFIQTNAMPTRSKTAPFFGNIIVWNDPTARVNMINLMLKCRYPSNFTPPVNLLGL